jgi:hypothetical protein
MSTRLEILVASLRVLSSDARWQFAHLEESEVPGVVDELALEFDAISAAVDNMLCEGEIDQTQSECIKALDTRLNEMSGPSRAHLWTPEALLSASEWHEVRVLAKRCLELFAG